MKEVTICLDNFDLVNDVYFTIAEDRNGNTGILLFIPN